MRAQTRLSLCCAALALAPGSGARAQGAAPYAPDQVGGDRSDAGARPLPTGQDVNADSTGAAADVVVTGASRAQKVQDAPEAVTVFTDERRNLIGIETGRDVVNLTPSTSLQGEYLTIRGVGRYEDPGQGIDPGIGVNVDGAYTGSTSYLGQPDFLTDRVEVLRGPQSITGHNTVAGQVDIFSRRPTDDYHGEVRAGGNSFDQGYFDGAISGPVSDTLKFRLAGSYNRIDLGAQENDGSKQRPGTGDSLILEGQLEWRPTQDLNIWIRYQNFEQHYLGGYGVAGNVGLASPYLSGTPTEASLIGQNNYYGLAPNPQFGLAPNSNPSLRSRFTTDVNTLGRANVADDHTVTANVTYDLDWATLRYIGNYSQFFANTALDTDFNGRQYFASPTGRLVPSSYFSSSPQNEHWFSNELTLFSNTESSLQWLAGAYQYREDFRTHFEVDDPLASYLASPVLSTATLAPAAPNPSRAFYSQDTSLGTSSEALYAQVDQKLPADLNATAAFRYNWDFRKGSDSFREIYDVYGFYGDFPTTPRVGLDLTPAVHAAGSSQSYTEETGKLGLQWRPDPSLNVYASYARGYAPGGYDLGAFSVIPTVKPETLSDYEVGVKKAFGERLTLDLAGFYYDWGNLQVPLMVGVPSGRGGQIFMSDLVNAQRTTSTGFEAESVWSPLENLHATFLYSYVDAHFDEFRNNAVAGGTLLDVSTGATYRDLKGNQVPQSPRNRLSVVPTYVLHLGEAADLSLTAIYAYVGPQYYGVFTNDNYRAPGYSNLDLRAVYQPRNAGWTAILYARNVTNSTQYIYRAPSLVYPTQSLYTVNQPFGFGGELQYRF